MDTTNDDIIIVARRFARQMQRAQRKADLEFLDTQACRAACPSYERSLIERVRARLAAQPIADFPDK